MTRRGDAAHASVRRGDRRAGESSRAPPAQPESELHLPPSPQPEVDAPPPLQPEVDAPPPPPSPAGFAGGPDDLSLLRGFRDHEAAYVWRGQGRAHLRPISHGKKILEFPPTDGLRECLDRIRLRDLLMCSYSVIDKGLISALVERWHRETCSFHLPVGEMTITLDDVAFLTNLPIDGEFFSPAKLMRPAAIPILEEELQMSHEEAKAEVDAARGPGITFSKLRSICEEHLELEAAAEARGEQVVAEGQLRISEKAYILFLVGCLLLPDKSGDAVPASYFALVHSEERARSFSWGGMLLASLYSQLSEASLHKCKQISGCLGLLQV